MYNNLIDSKYKTIAAEIIKNGYVFSHRGNGLNLKN